MVISSKKLMLAMAGREMRAADIADETGLSRQTVSTIVQSGKCKPVTLGKIARALGVKPEQLVDMER
jgi:DNA-binding Xre family transcriptional regulator